MINTQATGIEAVTRADSGADFVDAEEGNSEGTTSVIVIVNPPIGNEGALNTTSVVCRRSGRGSIEDPRVHRHEDGIPRRITTLRLLIGVEQQKK